MPIKPEDVTVNGLLSGCRREATDELLLRVIGDGASPARAADLLATTAVD